LKTSEKTKGPSSAPDKPKAAQGKPKTAQVSAPDKPKSSAKDAQRALIAAARDKQAAAPDPMAMLEPKKLALRIGVPLVIIWIIAFAISGWIPKAVAGAVTLAVAGLVIWVLRTVNKTRAVADIIRTADTPEARKEALTKLETQFDKDDPAAVFARAQIELQEGEPRKALATLETIRLEKVMPPVADEARAQRAMIHLVLGETDEAKALCEKVDLTRHKEPKSRATIAAIVGEAWARSGQAKKAVELLETIDVNDATYADLKPQLLRARAFAYAWANDTKKMKQVLRALQAINAQYLASFITKKKIPGGVPPKGVHPLLEKEAFEMITRSGMMPRKMEYRRN
jgi:tetratricopeptide (TPR) repeat protein